MDTDATLRFPTSTSTESTNTVEYQYQPLHGDLTFRILTCHPGAYDDEVSISLAHANFDCETPEYEALSYLWGDTKVTVAIQCEGQSLQVTSNLFGALRRIRNEALPRQLWIDAICINQANLSERNKQVLLMSRIYRLALKVLIWIGEEDYNVEVAFQSFEISKIVLEDLQKNLPCSKIQLENLRRQNSGGLFLNDGKYSIFSPRPFNVLGRAWFSRAWTFQEICLASNAELLCGTRKIPWNTVLLYFALLDLLRPGLFELGGSMRMTRTTMEYYQHMKDPKVNVEYFKLSTILRQIHREATDPRDRIYALLSISEVGDDPFFRPNYFESMEETYIRFTRAIVVREQRLQILSDAGSEDRSAELPSWTRDWRYKARPYAPISFRKHDGSARYTVIPEGHRKDISLDTTDKSRLQLYGYSIDKVSKTYDLSIFEYSDSYNTNWDAELYRFLKVLRMIRDVDLSKRYQESRRQVLALTLSADSLFCSARVDEAEKQEKFGWHKEFFDSFVDSEIPLLQRTSPQSSSRAMVAFLLAKERWLESRKNGHYDKRKVGGGDNWHWPKQHPVFDPLRQVILNNEPEESWSYPFHAHERIYEELWTAIKRYTSGRCLFATKNGRLGIGSDSIVEGDNVYALLGGDVLYILRQAAQRFEFKLIGEAYVHGIMDGELSQEYKMFGPHFERLYLV